MVPSRISVVLVEETKAGDTSRPECPCIDQEKQPLADPNRPLGGAVSEVDMRGGGALPFFPVLPGGCFRLIASDVTKTTTLSVGGPRSVPSRISVVLVDGTIAGDTPGRECPREDGFWRLRAGKTRPANVSVGGGDAGLPRVGETLSSLDVAGGPGRWCPLGGPPQRVLRTLWAPMARLLQVAPLARARHCLHISMTLWDR